MGQAIGEILPFAVVAALSPIPIIALVAMLLSPAARRNTVAYLGGWVVGLTVVTTATVLVAGGPDDPGSTGLHLNSGVQIALGVLLLVAGVRRWRGRTADGEEKPMPRWLAAVDTVTPRRALGLGLAASAVNPKALAMSIAAGLSIAQAGGSTADQIVPILLYVGLASAALLAPVVVYLVRPEQAGEILAGWRTWLAANDSVVMAVLYLVIAAVLIGRGISGLST